MTETKLDRGIILVLRLLMGWTFLYAGAWQIWDNFDTAKFLDHVVTFHAFFSIFGQPTVLPITDFLVKWGHLLIGLSLISGLMVRISGPFGVLLMITYYFAHMKFPYIEEPVNFLVDYHLVYATVIVYLIAHRAGHVFGLDGLVEQMQLDREYPMLKPLVG
ncbi:MAG TPA: DoxX family protein [Xanthobacteraceae bacterium]|jgi:thiosulfate dehydrogenase (quinone) large subunit|nr:DoxX family protein [Xanthobacteraceae bacterium]